MIVPMVPLKRRAQVIAGQSPDSSAVALLQDGLPFLQGNAEFAFEHPSPQYQCDVAKKVCQPGDVLVSVRAPVGAVNVADRAYGIGRGLAAVRPLAGSPRFLKWVLEQSSQQLLSIATGSTFEAISGDDLRSLMVPMGDDRYEASIANYLDRETAKIDALIEKQHRLIAGLRVRRSSAIAHGVAGSGREGPKKSSGLPWLSDVPERWAVGNIRRFATMKTGHTPSRNVPEYWTDAHIPWITLADVWQLRGDQTTHIRETAGNISKLGLQNSAAELLPVGTVILSRTASVGFAGIMSEPMATSQDYWNWICGPQLIPEFLLYVFRAMRQEFKALSAGSTHKTIYKEDAASFRIPVPPIDEQREIIESLDRETTRIDTLIAKSERLIELSRERRSALITAAVTGQIDVTEKESGKEAA